MTAIFTIVARNYLSLALTLGDSVRQQHPEAHFTIFLSDGLDGIELLNLDHAVEDARAAIGDSFDYALPFKYNILEFCTAIKPALFRYLFARLPGATLVYYLDPDTYLFNRLDPVVEAAPTKTLFLTPHLLDCRLADDHPYPEYKHLWEGIFNLGFCAIQRSPFSDEIIDWWDQRLRNYCYADTHDGLHADQKWMDYAPVFFEDHLSICRDYRVNVAHWNLVERLPMIRGNSCQGDGGDFRLILFHFSGIEFNGVGLTKHVPIEKQVYLDAGIIKLADDYKSAVMANSYHKFITIPYLYSTYSDGTLITQFHRRLFRITKSDDSINPFDCFGEFRRGLDRAGLVDEIRVEVNNYSAASLVKLPKIRKVSNSINLSHLFLKLILKLIGVKYYSRMLKFFEVFGRYESHYFLLKSKS